VVVSRDRPQALAVCLQGLSRLTYPQFEVIVVADASGLAAAAPWAGRIRTVAFDQPNISAARNAGLVQAAGRIVAFIDDDAVPFPDWLTHLAGAMQASGAVAAGGHVRGRDGLSPQGPWRHVDAGGDGPVIALAGPDPRVIAPRPGLGVKTEGTNMAFNRATLAALGGFDPAYAFYLDETDLNLRLAATGAQTVLVPRAQVIHGMAESPRRRADRVPHDLVQVGASLAVFARRHAHPDPDARLAAEVAARRRGLIAHMGVGRIEPRAVNRILRSLHDGWALGQERDLPTLPPLPSEGAFLPFPSRPHRAAPVILSGRIWQARRLRAQAAAQAAQGADVVLILLSPTARRHRLHLDPAGFWEQRGGLFGPAGRGESRLAWWTFPARIASIRWALSYFGNNG
jgi:hypothetical protein